MRIRLFCILASLWLISAVPASAGYTGLYVFGDSLSDTGNVFAATGSATPPPPYFQGRFSDGPVWIDHLAAGLALPDGALPALLGGTNFAFGGARTGGIGTIPSTAAQVSALWLPTHAGAVDPDALYVLVAGGNDMRDARSAFGTTSAADTAGRRAAAELAIGNLAGTLEVLATNGARNVLVANLPDLGVTPEAVGLGLVDASNDASAQFNSLIPTLLSAGTTRGLTMHLLDLDGLFEDVLDDALNNSSARFGIANLTSPCGLFVPSGGPNCAVSLFSDRLHPSAVAHRLIAERALAVVMPTARVPAPASVLLLLGAAIITLRRHTRRS